MRGGEEGTLSHMPEIQVFDMQAGAIMPHCLIAISLGIKESCKPQ